MTLGEQVDWVNVALDEYWFKCVVPPSSSYRIRGAGEPGSVGAYSIWRGVDCDDKSPYSNSSEGISCVTLNTGPPGTNDNVFLIRINTGSGPGCHWMLFEDEPCDP
jgi:hypothetical protein